jgi:glycosyltransferase involved in cell wall biosynthesis
MGLWATLVSCENELEGSGFGYKYIVVQNGVCEPLHGVGEYLGDKLKLIISEKPLSPGMARQAGIDCADGKILFFLDNHCLVHKDYFNLAVEDFEKYPEIDELHSGTKCFSGGPVYYHYHLSLQKNFWVDVHTEAAQRVPLVSDRPYRILMGGHGGFAVRRCVFNDVGGYWNGIDYYGGDEPYLDLKMARMGKTNWIDPRVVHTHYMALRNYPKLFTDSYYKQLMSVAYVIGGSSWAKKVRDSFVSSVRTDVAGMVSEDLATQYIDPLFDKALERGREHCEYLTSVSKYSLDEVLKYCDNAGIPR